MASKSVLIHYGILGMKWGVRRTPEQLGHKKKGLNNLSKKSSSSSLLEDNKVVNQVGKYGYTNNCVNCLAAWEMRARGYDVVAKPRAKPISSDNYLNAFKDVKFKSATGETNLISSLSNEGRNARGYLMFNINNGEFSHALAWSTDSDKKVTLYDPQNAKAGQDVLNYLKYGDSNYVYCRLDNLQVTDDITSLVKNRR